VIVPFIPLEYMPKMSLQDQEKEILTSTVSRETLNRCKCVLYKVCRGIEAKGNFDFLSSEDLRSLASIRSIQESLEEHFSPEGMKVLKAFTKNHHSSEGVRLW
jgi:hypothetical protein